MKELKSLSKTRWSCQWREAEAVFETIEAIICTAEFFVEDISDEGRKAAEAIINFVDTDFVVCLSLFSNLLYKTSMVRDFLQRADIDLARSVEMVQVLKREVQSPELFENVWSRAFALISRLNIPAPIQRRRERCREDADERAWTKQDYKERLFDPLVAKLSD